MLLSIVFDVLILIIIVFCTLMYFSRGFVSGLINFIGVFIAIVGSYFLAKYTSVLIFNSFVRVPLIERTVAVIGTNKGLSLQELIHALLAFLPMPLVNRIAESAGAGFENITASLAETIVDEVVASVLIPVIAIILFIITFFIVKAIVKALVKLFRTINRIPVVGGINKALGSVMGVLIGILYSFFAVCIMWTIDALSQMTFIYSLFPSSFVLRAMDVFNFFK